MHRALAYDIARVGYIKDSELGTPSWRSSTNAARVESQQIARPSLSRTGYRLIGGRADYLDHQRAAVVVYQHGQHIINVFSWAANQGALSRNTTRNGYHLLFWRAGDLEYCAVSDTAWDELLGLVRLLRDLSARDRRE